MDNLLSIVVTYTNVASDPKAKVLCYAALAGGFLIAHVLYAPFDDRKTSLCDRIEMLGLVVRFHTMALVELLLIFPSFGGLPAACFSMYIIFACLWYNFKLWTHAIC